jgi:hypothetical protein
MNWSNKIRKMTAPNCGYLKLAHCRSCARTHSLKYFCLSTRSTLYQDFPIKRCLLRWLVNTMVIRSKVARLYKVLEGQGHIALRSPDMYIDWPRSRKPVTETALSQNGAMDQLQGKRLLKKWLPGCQLSHI